MCGLAGILYFDKRPIGEELSAMAQKLHHRGPDQHGEWLFEHSSHTIGVVHRRLAIRDLSDAGRQPMASQSGLTILAYNGELYNDPELARKLERGRGIFMRTSCDSEVLVEALESHGYQVIRDLNGIFAFAAYDRESGELLLARDPFGVKPLYLWRDPTQRALAFASEVKAFLALPTFTRRINPNALVTLLAQGYVGSGISLMNDVTSLLPGQVLRVSPRGDVTELLRLSVPTHRDGERCSDTAFAAKLLRPHFEEAVARQRASDVPVAVWQSGGIDSTLIHAACRSPRPTALTITSDLADFDELAVAQRIGAQLGSNINPIALESQVEDASAEFASLVWHVDGELADSSAIAVKRLSAATKRHATVVLSGDGADELFGGYATYAATRIAARVAPLVPQKLSHALARWCFAKSTKGDRRYARMEWAARFLQGLPAGHFGHAEWRRYAMPWSLERLIEADYRELVDTALDGYRAAIRVSRDACPDEDPAHWGQVADINYYLPGDMLMKVDRMSMAHSLEVRVPFLDLEFVAHVAEIQSSLRLPQGRRTKPVLRQMLSAYGFGPDITERSKTGFNVALAKALRTTYRNTMLDLVDNKSYIEPFLSVDQVRIMCDEHLRGIADHAYAIWSIMTFAQWRKHLDI